ncbi:hypothetical protein DET47_106135 [Shewanella putrefaciens]|nr:hypothetical protein DET47_106135 [Shewanella putrefaciens]
MVFATQAELFPTKAKLLSYAALIAIVFPVTRLLMI